MSSLADEIQKARDAGVALENLRKNTEPVWHGPQSNTPQGGVTQTLLSRWIVDRERFRIMTVDGLAPQETFQHKLEFGNLWHICEEHANHGSLHHANGNQAALQLACQALNSAWSDPLRNYALALAQKFNMQQGEVHRAYQLCKLEYPIYTSYWRNRDVLHGHEVVFAEREFCVPYKLPSGRTVYLRGKWDKNLFVSNGDYHGLWIQENKTKGTIDPLKMQRELRFDLQTGLYMVAFREFRKRLSRQQVADFPHLADANVPLRGVLYNVIRRPLSSGRHSIRPHKPTKKNVTGETDEQFYARLRGLIEGEPSYFFMRWLVSFTDADFDRFIHTFLNPCLEQLCDWWDVVANTDDPYRVRSKSGSYLHFRMPYGIFNPLLEGRIHDLDNYMETGSRVGLRNVTNLFPELRMTAT